MSEKKIRRLAAIMFTDIAGYTRLMQESEARADQIRNRHREVFDYFHRQFNGQILQYYGDGTLSIFDSCVDAVQCAIAMQRELQGEPAVPLRIGIHLGDIVRSESDIYGDGVNVAARVESLGLPGAVMISGDIRKQINNQEIEAVSMGHFEMKNVATPIEVFAIKALGLVLPKAEELQGKAKRLEPIPSSLFQTGRWIRFAVPGIAVIALAATLLWSLIGGGNKQDQLLPESVREEKVAVAILNNHTGDESLDVLGFLMSEWLSSSLREIGIKTVSSDMVRQYQNYVNILPNDPEGRPAFSDLTGARYILEGSYYLFGQNQDSIRLFTRLNSAETGEQIQGFPTIVGEKQDKERLVEEIRQRLLGFWAMRKDFQLPSAKPPKYEAYQAFLKCRPPEFPCYRQAVALDSSFMLARVFLLQAAAVFDQDSIYRANESYIRRNWETCTTYEKNYFRYITAEQQLDFEAAFEAIEANYQMDPKDILMINESAVKAWWLLNRPNICLERFGNLFDQIDKFKDQIWPRNFAHYLQVLNHFGRHQEVIDFVNAFNLTYLFEKVGGRLIIRCK